MPKSGRSCSLALLVVVLTTAPGAAWEWDMENAYDRCSRPAGTPLIDGSSVFVPVIDSSSCADRSGDLRIQALDHASGAPRWRWSLSEQSGGCHAGRLLGVTDGDLIVGATSWPCYVPEIGNDFFVVRIDGASGTERWRRAQQGVVLLPDGDVIAAEPGTVARLDGQTGDERWSHALPDLAPLYAAARPTGDLVLALYDPYPYTTTVLVLDLVSGMERSRIDLGGGHVLAIDGDGHVVIGSVLGEELTIVELDAQTWGERWRYVLRDWRYVAPSWYPDRGGGTPVTLGPDGTVFVVGSQGTWSSGETDVGVLALDGDSGAERWRKAFAGGPAYVAAAGQIALAADGDIVAATEIRQRAIGQTFLVTRLGGQDGGVRWVSDGTHPAADWPRDSGASFVAVADDGTIVVSGTQQSIDFYPVVAVRALFATSGARVPCGNGVIDAGEACDDANAADGDGCDRNCSLTGCGNGVVDPHEGCDPGNIQWGASCRADCTSDLSCAALDLRGSWRLHGYCASWSFASSVQVSWSNDDVLVTQECGTGAVRFARVGCTDVTVDVTTGVGAGAMNRRIDGTAGCDGTPLAGTVDGYSVHVPRATDEPRGLVTLAEPIPIVGCTARQFALGQQWRGTITEDRLGHGAAIDGWADLDFWPLDADGTPCGVGYPAAMSCSFALDRNETPNPPAHPTDPPDPSPPSSSPDDDDPGLTPAPDGRAPTSCAGLRGAPAVSCVLAAAWPPDACLRQSLPHGIARPLRKVRRLLRRNRLGSRGLRALPSHLRRARVRAERAGERGALPAACADAIAEMLARAGALVQS